MPKDFINLEVLNNLKFEFKAFMSAFMSIFAVIDPISTSIVVLSLKKKIRSISYFKSSVSALVIMLIFLFLGKYFLKIFGIDISSFAIAGGIILFVLAIELIFGISFSKIEVTDDNLASIVPVAFPMFVGASTFSTLLTLRISYGLINIIAAIIGNSFCIYIFLKYSSLISDKLGDRVMIFINKVMGIIILSIAIKIFKTHLCVPIS